MSSDLRAASEAFYRFLWPSADVDNTERFAFLSDDLGGLTTTEIALAIADELDIGPGHVVVDAGCGRGRQAAALAKERGCRVIAVDPFEHNLELARARARDEGVGGEVELVRGALERLPVEAASADLVWCGDSYNHVEDPVGTLAACARALRPGGTVANLSAVATDTLDPGEAERFCEPLGLNPATLAPTSFDGACAAAGLRVSLRESTFASGSRFFEGVGDAGIACERYASMIRAPQRAIERLGDDGYRRLAALYLYNVCLAVGKLEYHLWLARR